MSSYSFMSSDDDQSKIGEIDDDLNEAARQAAGADATAGDAAAAVLEPELKHTYTSQTQSQIALSQ